jgi:hypothetical protein
MTLDEWIAAHLATAPPLTPEQVAVLRSLFRPAIQHAGAVGGAPDQVKDGYCPMTLTPQQEARDAIASGVPRNSLSMAAQLIYDELAAGRPHPEPVRFPSPPEARREILEEIARSGEKYARPFDRGRVAGFTLIGTESWAEYGAVVLQMAILDTLLSIEEKLGKLAGPGGEETA